MRRVGRKTPRFGFGFESSSPFGARLCLLDGVPEDVGVLQAPHDAVLEPRRRAFGRAAPRGEQHRRRVEAVGQLAKLQPHVRAGRERHLALARLAAEEHEHPPPRRARRARRASAFAFAAAASRSRRGTRAVPGARALEAVPQDAAVREPGLRGLEEHEARLLHAAHDVHVREHREAPRRLRRRRPRRRPYPPPSLAALELELKKRGVVAREEEPVEPRDVAEAQRGERALSLAHARADPRVAETRGGVVRH